jgi:hypothetical protein
MGDVGRIETRYHTLRAIPQTLKDYQLRNRGDIFVMNNGPLECYKMHCGVRLHGQNACYVIFWNIAPKHWIYMECTVTAK